MSGDFTPYDFYLEGNQKSVRARDRYFTIEDYHDSFDEPQRSDAWYLDEEMDFGVVPSFEVRPPLPAQEAAIGVVPDTVMPNFRLGFEMKQGNSDPSSPPSIGKSQKKRNRKKSRPLRPQENSNVSTGPKGLSLSHVRFLVENGKLPSRLPVQKSRLTSSSGHQSRPLPSENRSFDTLQTSHQEITLEMWTPSRRQLKAFNLLTHTRTYQTAWRAADLEHKFKLTRCAISFASMHTSLLTSSRGQGFLTHCGLQVINSCLTPSSTSLSNSS